MEDSVVPEPLKEDWIDKVLQHDVCMSLGLNVDEGRSLVTLKPGFGYLGAHAEVANHLAVTEAERRVPLVFRLWCDRRPKRYPVETGRYRSHHRRSVGWRMVGEHSPAGC